jgi:hypothetical protein
MFATSRLILVNALAILAIAPINHHRSSIRVFTTRMRLTADKYCDGESDVNMLHLKAGLSLRIFQRRRQFFTYPQRLAAFLFLTTNLPFVLDSMRSI